MSEPKPTLIRADILRDLGLAVPDPRLRWSQPDPVRGERAVVVAVDTMVEEVHFPATTAPRALGHKCLAVNLSDLAAMGAEPVAALLSLCLPRMDRAWLAHFGAGFRALADVYSLDLNGAEFLFGPLTVTVQVAGRVHPDRALRRAGARPGDGIFVTGHLGDAGMGLRLRAGGRSAESGHRAYLEGRLDCPTPRVAVGVAIRDLATAAIDVSDGLAADLGHVVADSGVGATIQVHDIPLSPALCATAALEEARALALSAGDDYELCFTVEPGAQAEVELRLERLGCPGTRIGTIEEQPGVRFVEPNGLRVHPGHGYEHFDP